MIRLSAKPAIVADRFDQAFNEITSQIDAAMQRAGKTGVDEAKRRSRVSELVKVHMRDRNEFIRLGLLNYTLQNLTPYAPYLNFGTRYIAADHFFDIAAQVMIRAFHTEVKAIRIT